MRIFHLLLSVITTGLILITFYFIWITPDFLYHAFFGLIATIAALITHCWIFFYFIGTGEGIREGIQSYHLDQSAIKRTKKFKGKTFPFALFSMIFLIVASILGGALRFGKADAAWHIGFVLFAFAFNIFTFFQEAKVLKENEELMQSLNQKIDEKMNES